ncbi:DUF819 family protein [Helcobacillus sp. ACRRO]|uniref:DUF819 family protein n=1 Tax=Helcobacillus sp. ACRRO TaxID=2918202 RepID=UPI001EF40A4D|nr:DUF819 family protein [Helcobacillus sp. ACRRO]MCG7427243.1 DUF819 family protein [Helcobacillus sp. ACRRO]
MIENGLLMLSVILGLSCILIVLEKTTGWKLFKFVPGMVMMYLICAALNSVGVFSDAEGTRQVAADVKTVILPAMIFLFLFGCDFRRIIKLGPKLLLTYFVAAASLAIGVVVVFLAFKALLHPESWKVFGALLASWTGGSANMVAVQDVLQAPETIFGYALITDTIVYSFWLMAMFSSVAVSDRFNRFTKADTSVMDTALDLGDTDEKPITAASLGLTVFGSLTVAILAIELGDLLPEVGDVLNGTAWTIIIVSILGVIVAHTPLGRIGGSTEIATLMLFIVIGQIATGSDFSAITQAPLYLVAGFLVLLVHVIIMVIYAKLTRTELFSLAVASTANIGGIASAPVVASAFSRQMVPVGVLYALIGSLLGTFMGLAVAQLLSQLV